MEGNASWDSNPIGSFPHEETGHRDQWTGPGSHGRLVAELGPDLRTDPSSPSSVSLSRKVYQEYGPCGVALYLHPEKHSDEGESHRLSTQGALGSNSGSSLTRCIGPRQVISSHLSFSVLICKTGIIIVALQGR